MKREISVIVLCVVGICVFASLYDSKSEYEEEGLWLMNVEALATGESEVPIDCMGVGCLDCPGYSIKVKPQIRN